jgi:hypothetical protein
VRDVDKLEKHIEFVKEQLEFQQKQSKKFATEPRRSGLHIRAADSFQALLDDLISIEEIVDSHPEALNGKSFKPSALTLSWEEVEGLPAELLEELSISESDKTEFNIISILKSLGGAASLDRLLVALYKQSGEITKRATLNQRIYRMVQKNMIYNVPNKKGVYSISQLSEEQAELMV